MSASGTVEVRNSVIELNASTGRGGGLSVGEMSRSTAARRAATRRHGRSGGTTLGGSLTVLESANIGKHANLFGGGVFQSGFASLTISNSTMAGNSAAFGGQFRPGFRTLWHRVAAAT